MGNNGLFYLNAAAREADENNIPVGVVATDLDQDQSPGNSYIRTHTGWLQTSVDQRPIVQQNTATQFDKSSAGISASRYGIVHSTTKDQTVAFQTMFDDVASSYSGARRIILPHGQFNIDGDVDIKTGGGYGYWPDDINVTATGIGGIEFLGHGIYASQIRQQGVGGTIRVYTPSSTQRDYTQLEIGGMSIIGQGLTNDANVGLQLGGVSVDATDILIGTKLHNLRIQNFATAIAADDNTATMMERVVLEGYKYGIEFGFNCDAWIISQCRFGSVSVPSGLACTTVNASATVTLTGGNNTTKIRAGMSIKAANFAKGTTVLSVDSSTVFTASTNATAGSADTLYFTQGIALSYGRGPFAPAASVTGSGNPMLITSNWFMKQSEAIAVDDGSTSSLKVDTNYFESCERIATLGEAANTTSILYAIFENNHISKANECFKDYAFYENGTSAVVGNITLRNNRADQQSPVPWLRLRGGGSVLTWENNLLAVSAGSRINVIDSTIPYNPADGSNFYYGRPGTNELIQALGTTGTLTPSVPPKAHNKYKVGAMTGAITIASPGTTFGIEGQRVQFIFLEDGTAGRVVTWNAAFHFHTAFVQSVATTDANKRTYVEFELTATSGVWMQVSPANVWVA